MQSFANYKFISFTLIRKPLQVFNMNRDLETIKKLEQELGFEIPVRKQGEKLPTQIGRNDSVELADVQEKFFCGAFLDHKSNVIAFGLNRIESRITKFPENLFKLTQLSTLALDRQAISSIPAEISRFKKLEHLRLIDNDIVNLPPKITKLSHLNELYLGRNRIISFPDEVFEMPWLKKLILYDNNLNSIPSEISRLEQLLELSLGHNNISKLPNEVSKLKLLTSLNLSMNNISAFPHEVVDLTNLNSLNLSNNNISSLPPELLQLSSLKTLNLGYNNISELPIGFDQLINLKEVDLSHNNLLALPPEIVNLQGLTEFYLSGNPLTTPPIEIADQGIDSIKDYFVSLKNERGETRYLFESKLLIIGDGGTGKTSFRRKIVNPHAEMPIEEDTTRGIDVDHWTFTISHLSEQIHFNVNMWDFGGQQLYRGTHQMFFSEKSYYVLLSCSREQATDYSYWLNTIRQLAGEECAVLILLNEKHGRGVKFDERGYRGHFGGIIKSVESLDLSKDFDAVRNLQDLVKIHLKQLSGIGDPLPPSWVQIREEIAEIQKNIEMGKNTSKFISFDEFQKICNNHNVEDPSIIHALSVYYTRIGVFTHYIDDELLRERVYLDSNWLLDTVYEVLENVDIKKREGRLTAAEITTIWGKRDLDFEVERLAKLMNRFGLMYRVRDTDKYVVPEHLPIQQPYDVWPHSGELLHFIYEFDKYMPPGLMSRLIVALHHLIEDERLVWYNGVNLILNKTHAEIIESYGAINSFKIRIKGTEKIELLSMIRDRFAEVLSPFKNLNYKQHVPCLCNECNEAEFPEFHEYKKLLNLREKGKGSQCYRSGELVDVSKLLRLTEFYVSDFDKIDLFQREAFHQGLDSRRTYSRDEENSLNHFNRIADRPDKTEEVIPAKFRRIEIFLASSEELKDDREQIEIWINRQNKQLTEQGIFLHLNLWEDFLESISKNRLQDEYNKSVEQSDIFISLFSTKVGKYTEEEFETAYNNFMSGGKTQHVFTFFKRVKKDITEIDPNDFMSLTSFRNKLKKLQHFPSYYENEKDLTGQLKEQLDKIIKI